MKKSILTISLLLILGPASAQVYSLDQCVELALKNKETLKSANLDVESARLGKRGALSTILPSFGVGMGLSQSNFPERINYATGDKYSSASSTSRGYQISQNIYDGGAWWNSIASAKNNYLIGTQLKRQVKINVIYGVVQAYYNLLKSQQLLDVARMNLMLANQQVELVTNQFEIGAAAKTDLLKVNVLRGQAQVQVINQDTQQKTAQWELLNAMGIADAADQVMIAEETEKSISVPDYSLTDMQLEENNPSILAKKAQIKGSRLNHKIIRSSRLPQLSADYRYNFQSADLSGLRGDDDWSKSLSVNLSVPLFTGFDLHTRTQQARLNISKEENEYIEQLNNLRVQLAGLLEVLRNYSDLIPINEEVLTSAEEDLNLVQEQYALGSVTILEVLDAQLSVTQARSSLVSTKYDAQIQAAGLKALLGTLDREY